MLDFGIEKTARPTYEVCGYVSVGAIRPQSRTLRNIFVPFSI